jgi:hypothetical protein
MQIFREVSDRRADLGVNRMRFAIRRVPQREERQIESARFEGMDLLCDEGLGQARIALEDHRDNAGRTRTIHPVSVSPVLGGGARPSHPAHAPRESHAGSIRC